MRKLALAALAAVLLAAAQTPPAAAEIDADAKIARLRQENPVWAVAVFDVTVSKDGEGWCFPHVILKSSTGKTVDFWVRTGPISLTGIRRARAKVEDLEPEAIESLRKRAPSTYAKAKQRYFAIDSKLKWHDVPPPQD